ncbi:hypothetical protein ACKC9G_08305 [Pokkaliibacter sp. CJK22405]|uniref:hypothetical protein n=1 Tax=Pokkaliibacter sp. CJK22405 TaxID=3384615 RepID=UPI003984DAF2
MKASALAVMMTFTMTTAHAEQWSCQQDVDGFVQNLSVQVEDGQVTAFHYQGSTEAFEQQALSCAMQSVRAEGVEDWDVKGNHTDVSFRGNPRDKVEMVQMGDTLMINLGKAALYQCSKGAVTAEMISISRDEPWCFGISLRQ